MVAETTWFDKYNDIIVAAKRSRDEKYLTILP